MSYFDIVIPKAILMGSSGRAILIDILLINTSTKIPIIIYRKYKALIVKATSFLCDLTLYVKADEERIYGAKLNRYFLKQNMRTFCSMECPMDTSLIEKALMNLHQIKGHYQLVRDSF